MGVGDRNGISEQGGKGSMSGRQPSTRAKPQQGEESVCHKGQPGLGCTHGERVCAHVGRPCGCQRPIRVRMGPV